jgi:hypothetical protein
MVLDGGKEQVNNHRAILERELETVGLRLNKKPPNIYFKKKKDGGVKFNSTVSFFSLLPPSSFLVFSFFTAASHLLSFLPSFPPSFRSLSPSSAPIPP